MLIAGYDRPLVSLVVIVAASAVAAADQVAVEAPDDHAPAAEVIVERGEARITIDIPAQTMWHWNLRESPEGMREYAWEVSVDTRKGKYRLGFSLFKFRGAVPRSGTLAELLRAGQCSVWRVTGDRDEFRGELLETVRIRVEPAGNAIRIQIKGRSIIERLFGERPPEVEVVRQSLGRDMVTERVHVRYAAQ